jgi:hypothetical protein
MLQRWILGTSLAAALLLSIAWMASYLRPILIEQAGRHIVRLEVERRTGLDLSTLPDARIAGMAERVLRKADAPLAQARRALLARIDTVYAAVTASLMREFRIVTGTNAVAFVLLAALAHWHRRDARQLLLPTLVLVGAVLVTGGFYLIGQDWVHTIVFGTYVGLAYGGYLALVALLLADVAFNRARVILFLTHAVLSVVGAALA